MQTITEQSPVVADAKAEFLRAKDRLVKDLATTPDDKINWSPSSTCRTPLHLVAHAAMSIPGMQGMLEGKPFPFSGPEELDTFSRNKEKEFTTREQVLDLLETNSDGYLAFLDSLTPEQLASNWEMPFGSFPMTSAITFIADHLRCHAGQLEYVQTIYGDLDWHMG